MSRPPPESAAFDVIVMGGALSGASAALLLRRELPTLRVLVIERAEKFSRRVGEATVEVSAYFLGRVLGLTQYLNEAHLVKQGMRFWFAHERADTLAECSEIGGGYLARVPAYQVDRAALDEEVLRRAVSAGVELWRPATVQRIALHAGGAQLVTVRCGEDTRHVRARWVIDASGVAAVLARQEGWFQPNTAHPTASAWARWRGVKDWDGRELAEKFPEWSRACFGIRGTATNHFLGDGWWAWCIPLKGGDVSIGVTFDQRLVKWPEGGALGSRLKEFLSQHPVAREILGDAQWVEGDVHWRKPLPYSSRVFAGDGFVLAGDAAAFLDPFYSPGMDWIAFTVTMAVEMICAERRGEAITARVAEHNRRLERSYTRWFEAIYRDKYEYMGDFELMRVAFLLDLGLYYLGVASQPYRLGARAFTMPIFTTGLSAPVYYFMRTYNRRLAQMARGRRERGQFGRRNQGERFMFGGYTFARSSLWPIGRSVASWLWLELTEGWRSWRRGSERIPRMGSAARRGADSDSATLAEGLQPARAPRTE